MTRYELEKIKEKLYERVKSIDLSGGRLNYIDVNDIDVIDDADFEDDIAGRTKLAEDFTMDDLITILTDGLSMECGFEKVDYDKNEYYQAKAELMAEGWTEDMLTVEAVEAKMLMMGFSLTFHEPDTHKKHKVTLKTILRGFDKFIRGRMKEWGCSRMHAIMQTFGNGDFYDYDAILQTAIYGEVVYG